MACLSTSSLVIRWRCSTTLYSYENRLISAVLSKAQAIRFVPVVNLFYELLFQATIGQGIRNFDGIGPPRFRLRETYETWYIQLSKRSRHTVTRLKVQYSFFPSKSVYIGNMPIFLIQFPRMQTLDF